MINTMLLSELKDFPVERTAAMIRDAQKQKCYLDTMYCLANSDIAIERVKARVNGG